jgi:hypothetical protein
VTVSESILDKPLHWAAGIASLALSGALVFVLLMDVRPAVQQWGRAPQQIADLTTAVELVPGQIAGQVLARIVPLVDHHAGLLRRDLFGAVAGVRDELFPRVDVALGIVDQSATAAIQILDLRGREALQQVRELRADLQPTLANAASITAHADGAAAILFRRDALPAQLLGVTAAAKVALGETAQTMRTINDAAPAIAANVQRATDESAITAQQTRIFMGNLSEATKPLPKWARIGLAVAPPLVQTGFTLGSWLALKGKSQ